MIGALLCRLGRHAPLPDGQWNQGYCFTECRRCGRDMVRSAFGEWHVPRDFRVVWRPPGADAPPPVELRAMRGRPSASAETDERSPFDFADFEDEDGHPAFPPTRLIARGP